jgi:hypothetical protein
MSSRSTFSSHSPISRFEHPTLRERRAQLCVPRVDPLMAVPLTNS